jgi:hypothetical protein
MSISSALAKNDAGTKKTDQFDGSEFKREEFASHDFEKNDYRQIEGRGDSDSKFAKGDESHKSDDDRMGVSKDVKDDVSHRANKEQDKNQQIVAEPVHELAGDWVPDKIDATNNGGFGVAPDNGAPVPYNLNGHIDLQRERP